MIFQDMPDLSHSLGSFRSLIFSNAPSTPLQIVVELGDRGIYRYVLRHFSLSHPPLT